MLRVESSAADSPLPPTPSSAAAAAGPGVLTPRVGSAAAAAAAAAAWAALAARGDELRLVLNVPDAVLVGRCRLTLSRPVWEAAMVSALETTMCWTAFKFCFQFQLAPLHSGAGGHGSGGRACQTLPATSSNALRALCS